VITHVRPSLATPDESADLLEVVAIKDEDLTLPGQGDPCVLVETFHPYLTMVEARVDESLHHFDVWPIRPHASPTGDDRDRRVGRQPLPLLNRGAYSVASRCER